MWSLEVQKSSCQNYVTASLNNCPFSASKIKLFFWDSVDYFLLTENFSSSEVFRNQSETGERSHVDAGTDP